MYYLLVGNAPIVSLVLHFGKNKKKPSYFPLCARTIVDVPVSFVSLFGRSNKNEPLVLFNYGTPVRFHLVHSTYVILLIIVPTTYYREFLYVLRKEVVNRSQKRNSIFSQ